MADTLSTRLRMSAEVIDRPVGAATRRHAAHLMTMAADALDNAADAVAALDRQHREATAAEGYDSPEETHRRLVKLLEYVAGSQGPPTPTEPEAVQGNLEHIEERLANIIRDMPANRLRENDRSPYHPWAISSSYDREQDRRAREGR